MPELLGYQFDRVFARPIERYRQVSTIAERDAIPTGKRWKGMLCYVTGEEQDYQLSGGLTNLDWIKSGSGDFFDLNEHTSDDITEGVVNLFLDSTQDTKINHISVTQNIDLDNLKTTVDAIGSGLVFKGVWDASGSAFPSSADTGFMYIVDTPGLLDGVSFSVGDSIAAIVDNASTSTFDSNWVKFESVSDVTSVVGLGGAISKTSLLSALNVEDGATADLTGLEIVNLLNTELTTSNWQTRLSIEEVLDMVGAAVNDGSKSGITVNYDDDNNEFDFLVDPFIQVYSNLSILTSTQHLQKSTILYEVTDASDFSTITSGKAWVRWKGTTVGDETDYIIVSKEEALTQNGSIDSVPKTFNYTSGAQTFTMDYAPNNVDVYVNRTWQYTTAYTLVGDEVTITGTLYSGDIVTIRPFGAARVPETFIATEGQTVFNLSGNYNNVDAHLGRTWQYPTSDYTLTGNLLTLTKPAKAGDILTVRPF